MHRSLRATYVIKTIKKGDGKPTVRQYIFSAFLSFSFAFSFLFVVLLHYEYLRVAKASQTNMNQTQKTIRFRTTICCSRKVLYCVATEPNILSAVGSEKVTAQTTI